MAKKKLIRKRTKGRPVKRKLSTPATKARKKAKLARRGGLARRKRLPPRDPAGCFATVTKDQPQRAQRKARHIRRTTQRKQSAAVSSSQTSVSSVAKPSEAAAQKRKTALALFLAGRRVSTHQVRLVCDYIRPLFARVPQKLVEELLGSSRKVLLEWTGQGAPRNADGTWPLPPLMQWLKAKWVKASRRGGIPDADGQVLLELDPRRRREAADAEIAEMRRDEMKGRLAPREELVAERMYADRITKEFSVGLADIEHQAARTFGGEKGGTFLAWLGRAITKVRERLAKLRE